MLFAGVLERLPRLRIGFAHGGGSFPGHDRPHPARLRRPARPVRHRHDARAAPPPRRRRTARRASTSTRSCTTPTCCATCSTLFGPDRVALGTDYPFPLGETEPGALIRSLGLDPEAERARARRHRARVPRPARAGADGTARERRRAGPDGAGRARRPDDARPRLPRARSPSRRGPTGGTRRWPTSPATRSGCSRRGARRRCSAELDDWARLGVEGHLEARHPWLPYHELLRDAAARLVGGAAGRGRGDEHAHRQPHLMMASFYRPTRRAAAHRHRGRAPSRPTATPSPATSPHHGLDPADAVVRLRPRAGEDTLRTEDIVARLERRGRAARARAARRRQLPHRPARRHRRRHRCRAPRRARSPAGTWRTPPATCRCSCTTGTSTSPPGARTSTSTPGPGAVAAALRARAPRPRRRPAAARRLVGQRPGDALPDAARVRAAAGRRRLAALQPADPLAGARARLAGAVRPQSACRRCASARCGSRATWSRCSTARRRRAPSGSSRRATRSAAAASSRSPSRAARPSCSRRLRHEHGVIADVREPHIAALRAGAALLHLPRLLARRRRARHAARSPAVERARAGGRDRRRRPRRLAAGLLPRPARAARDRATSAAPTRAAAGADRGPLHQPRALRPRHRRAGAGRPRGRGARAGAADARPDDARPATASSPSSPTARTAATPSTRSRAPASTRCCSTRPSGTA